jgi:hypothetical protein
MVKFLKGWLMFQLIASVGCAYGMWYLVHNIMHIF